MKNFLLNIYDFLRLDQLTKKRSQRLDYFDNENIDFEHFKEEPFILYYNFQTSRNGFKNTETPILENITFKNVFFSGLAYGEAIDFIYSSASNNAPFTVDIFNNPPNGEWIAVFRKNDGSYRLKADHFGFYKLFYSTPDLNNLNLFACSNNFQALCEFLKNKGESLNIDIDYIAPLLISSSNFFYQAYSNRTSCKQIRRLGADEEIAISNKVEIQKNEFFLKDASTCDYNYIITKGLEKSKNILRKLIINSFSSSPSTLFLSGGKDSRAALCILLDSIGINNFGCFSHNPLRYKTNKKKWEEDLNIASILVDCCALKWAKRNKNLHRIQISFNQSLTYWQTYRSNTYFKYNAGKFLTKHDLEEVEIRGGVGDAIRGGFYNNLFDYSLLKGSKFHIYDDIVTLFKHIIDKEYFVNKIFNSSLECFY